MRRRAVWTVLSLAIPLYAQPGPAGEVPPSWRAPGTTLGRCGALLDVDGDGRAEALLGGPGATLGRAVGGVFLFELDERGGARMDRALQDGDSSGASLALLGDVDRDGKADFAVGAVNGGTEAPLSGLVAVYRGGDLGRPTRLSGEAALDRFGFSLAGGDLNGDGAPDLVVGAPMHSPSPGLYQKGAVYVFFGPSFEPERRVKLAGTAADGLGFAVAAGDVNGDGVDDLLLEGTAKVLGFYGKRGTFAPSTAAPDLTVKSAASGFGRALLVTGDLDGDSYGDLAVGAYRSAAGTLAEGGSVFLVRGGAGVRNVSVDSPSPALLARIDGPERSWFGSSLAKAPDLDLDGLPDLAVGAIHADAEGHGRSGRVWVLPSSGLSGGDPFAAALVLDGGGPDQHFGAFASSDGASQLLVGAPAERDNRGGFYLFDLAKR